MRLAEGSYEGSHAFVGCGRVAKKREISGNMKIFMNSHSLIETKSFFFHAYEMVQIRLSPSTIANMVVHMS